MRMAAPVVGVADAVAEEVELAAAEVLAAALLEGMAELVGVTIADEDGVPVADTVFTRITVRVIVWVFVDVTVCSSAATSGTAARQRAGTTVVNFMVSVREGLVGR